MGLLHYLFGFGGRINRAKIWAFLIVALVFEIVIVIAVQMTLGFGNILNIVQGKAAWASLGGRLPLFYAVCGVLYLLLIYMQMAVMTKRLHDRNKSAWWLLVFVVLPAALSFAGIGQAMYTLQHFHEIMAAAQSGHPYQVPTTPLGTIARGASSLLYLWMFVELYCLRGTVGDNRYGPDPLAGRG
jgi:uncharacterized membrane protein YhaH (DUF805 family)